MQWVSGLQYLFIYLFLLFIYSSEKKKILQSARNFTFTLHLTPDPTCFHRTLLDKEEKKREALSRDEVKETSLASM